MSTRQIVTKSQLVGAQHVLEALKREVAAEFVGLISTSGVLLLSLEPSALIDTDALASLAAGSFAATKQLALIMNESEFTVMFHEGSELNIHIALVAEGILLVVCFRKNEEIGKVRLISKRALDALARALKTDSITADSRQDAGDSEDNGNSDERNDSGGRIIGAN